MGARRSFQQQAVLAGRPLDVGRIFLEIDLCRLLDVAHGDRGRILDIEMRRIGCLRAPRRNERGRGCRNTQDFQQ
jgi:hypothetical protein